MTPLTGAGEQRGADEVDEQGDTLPLPAVPGPRERSHAAQDAITTAHIPVQTAEDPTPTPAADPAQPPAEPRRTAARAAERPKRTAEQPARSGTEPMPGAGQPPRSGEEQARSAGRRTGGEPGRVVHGPRMAARVQAGGRQGPPGGVRVALAAGRDLPAYGPLLRKVALGLAIGMVAVAGFAGLQRLADAPPETGAPGNTAQTPGTPSTTPDIAADGVRRAKTGGAVLQKMADAIRTESRSAFLTTIDPKATTFDQQARTVFANLGKLPLATFQLRYVSDDPAALSPDRQGELGGSASWLAQVEVSWQLMGFDTRPARETLPVTFVTRDGTTYAASFSERFVAGQRRPVWALGSIDVAKGDHSLVISLDSQGDADDYAAVSDRAVDAVTDVWGRSWRQKIVVYLPAKQTQMEQILGAQPNAYTQIAAVTMAELDVPQAGAPVRIVANPKLFDELGKQGRRIVLTHETTHVASTATASPVPLWLAEGFADYVAFTAVSVQDESAAKELFKAIRAGRVPKSLPAPEAFAASSAELPQAYESSWLACRLIAEREGQSKLVKFYRAVHTSKSPTALADAFKSVLGTTEQEFVADWQKYIKRLAGV